MVVKFYKKEVNVRRNIKITDEDFEEIKKCKFIDGNWCNKKEKCKYQTRVYGTGPEGGCDRKSKYYICTPMV